MGGRRVFGVCTGASCEAECRANDRAHRRFILRRGGAGGGMEVFESNKPRQDREHPGQFRANKHPDFRDGAKIRYGLIGRKIGLRRAAWTVAILPNTRCGGPFSQSIEDWMRILYRAQRFIPRHAYRKAIPESRHGPGLIGDGNDQPAKTGPRPPVFVVTKNRGTTATSADAGLPQHERARAHIRGGDIRFRRPDLFNIFLDTGSTIGRKGLRISCATAPRAQPGPLFWNAGAPGSRSVRKRKYKVAFECGWPP